MSSSEYTFKVAPSCTKCSACSHVCPSGIILMTADGPTLPNAKICIRCGHCVAVCPVDALDFSIAPLANQKKIDGALSIDSERAEQFLRSRRSIRNYRKKEVAVDDLKRMLEVAHYAPSGGNTQSVSYLVINKREILDKLSALTLDWIEEMSKVNASMRSYSKLIAINRETGDDVIFRGAPALVVAVGPRKMPIVRDNARFCLAYAELFAPTLGLGTCWAGFFEMCSSAYNKEVYDLLGLSEEQMVVGALMVGYPKYYFKRLVDRDGLDLRFV
jgi:nitroreductase/NAD-dependent dihydropyrimidine dehydrogenase PreA subunit